MYCTAGSQRRRVLARTRCSNWSGCLSEIAAATVWAGDESVQRRGAPGRAARQELPVARTCTSRVYGKAGFGAAGQIPTRRPGAGDHPPSGKPPHAAGAQARDAQARFSSVPQLARRPRVARSRREYAVSRREGTHAVPGHSSTPIPWRSLRDVGYQWKELHPYPACRPHSRPCAARERRTRCSIAGVEIAGERTAPTHHGAADAGTRPTFHTGRRRRVTDQLTRAVEKSSRLALPLGPGAT